MDITRDIKERERLTKKEIDKAAKAAATKKQAEIKLNESQSRAVAHDIKILL